MRQNYQLDYQKDLLYLMYYDNLATNQQIELYSIHIVKSL